MPPVDWGTVLVALIASIIGPVVTVIIAPALAERRAEKRKIRHLKWQLRMAGLSVEDLTKWASGG